MSHRIFLHGLGQGPSSWDKILSCLPEEKNVFCPDLFRFFGGEECTYQNLFGSFSRYCEKVKEPFHLCGLSLGAVLALHYGICHPQKVRSDGTHCAAVSNAKKTVKNPKWDLSPVAEGSFRRDGIREETDDLPDQFHAEFTAGRTVQKSQLPRVSTVWKKVIVLTRKAV